MSASEAGGLKLGDAAEMLDVSYRQAKRIWRQYRKRGADGLKHGNAGRRSSRAKPDMFRRQVPGLIHTKYSGDVDIRFGPTLAAQHLLEERRLAGGSRDARAVERREHRKRRERKRHFGELVQMDGSFHVAWLEDRGPGGCLMNMVDDATGVTLCRLGVA